MSLKPEQESPLLNLKVTDHGSCSHFIGQAGENRRKLKGSQRRSESANLLETGLAEYEHYYEMVAKMWVWTSAELGTTVFVSLSQCSVKRCPS